MYTLKQLEIFMALARTQKVIDVAHEFGMSQSAISMSIRELEKSLDEPLFERIGKRLVLNERGALLGEEVGAHVVSLRNVYERFRGEKLSGTVNVAASVTIADYLMPPLLTAYLQRHSGIRVSLKAANSAEVIRMVKEGSCTLGLIESAYDDPAVQGDTIMTDRLVVVSGDASLADHPRYIDSLASRKWILREKGSGTRSVFLDAIAPVDRELNEYLELELTESIKHFLQHDSQTISCLPYVSVRDEIEEKKLFAIEIVGHTFEREFTLITRKQCVLTAVAAHFKDYVLSTFKVE